MTLEEVRQKLAFSRLHVTEERRLPNNTGTQFRLDNGGVVNVFDSGKVVVQGEDQNGTRAVLGLEAARVAERNSTPYRGPKRKVFVVYGHDPDCRNQLEAMLRRWGLEPLILDQLPSEGQTIIEKLESSMAEADFGVVLATPDDEGHRLGRADEKALRARQNVVLELGMLLAKLGRPRVAILLKQQEKMERPSDIQGLIYIPFTEDLAKEASVALAKAMDAQGYQIDVSRL